MLPTISQKKDYDHTYCFLAQSMTPSPCRFFFPKPAWYALHSRFRTVFFLNVLPWKKDQSDTVATFLLSSLHLSERCKIHVKKYVKPFMPYIASGPVPPQSLFWFPACMVSALHCVLIFPRSPQKRTQNDSYLTEKDSARIGLSSALPVL